ncbi:hypothetical protein ASPZODRAFT_99402 [Penicilliopsis zonata CBS 506.65]|uniref:RED-like N-terminal domain-containing protein n=1 Tax=Penicilliopsis zonata CBS 506.65 TaxID=1073090 RepID=A0A1L9SDX1_9EURO|nr:hypothetical protein ASPZODRAFT_99402 [Penicilliopsis zonata CBS 506.65]OJJ45396.1 hypothetical protein ASPZODRAFT_99402 [Penicilliopsis zonata CBS 506.65]
MNNDQFRRLLFDDASKGSSSLKKTSPHGPLSSQKENATAGTPGSALLGSRMRSSIPMTPRSVTGVDFARQLAEHRRETDQPPTKRFKSSAAPKGTKLPSGYQDRTQQRQTQDESTSEVEKRIVALEEMAKLGQIDQATLDKLRSELGVGGDLKSTHMVKGLDWELLRRIRSGDDVNVSVEKVSAESEQTEEPVEEDVDNEFDRVLEERGKEVISSAPKEKRMKKGVLAAQPRLAAPTNQKKSRDEILRQLKASRAAAASGGVPESAETQESTLGTKFKRIGDRKPERKRFVESDETGRRREVLLITDAEGNTKRKVRWLDKPGTTGGKDSLLLPDKDAKPLGMEVPAAIAAKLAAATVPDDDDDDIFAGAGTDYNPLADIGDEDDSSSGSEDGEAVEGKSLEPAKTPIDRAGKSEPTISKPRNYFSTSSTTEMVESDDRSNPLTNDPTILAALKRAAALRQEGGEELDDDVDAETQLRRRKFLDEARCREAQDAMDMDLGFGSSRVEDGEDDEAVIFEERGAKKRKRGPKKKKGDKDSASDVLRVLEGRKKAVE